MPMVKINYCPSCGNELDEQSFICPKCSLDIEELFAKGYLLASNNKKNSIELFEGDEEIIVLDDEKNNSDDADEVVIVVPQDSANDELVIDFDELGIDVDDLGDNINIVVEVDGVFEGGEEFDTDKEYIPRANYWFYDDDPYGIVYYEYVNDD